MEEILEEEKKGEEGNEETNWLNSEKSNFTSSTSSPFTFGMERETPGLEEGEGEEGEEGEGEEEEGEEGEVEVLWRMENKSLTWEGSSLIPLTT